MIVLYEHGMCGYAKEKYRIIFYLNCALLKFFKKKAPSGIKFREG
jgi:hypothetical protein